MSAVCIDLLHLKAPSKNHGSRKSRERLQTFGPWLCRGEEISVFYSHLLPHHWSEHNHHHAELLLTFEAAQIEMNWRTFAGQQKNQVVAANQFCLVPPNVPHAFDWKHEADVVAVYISEQLFKTQVGRKLSNVVVGDFHPLTRLDTCLWSLAAIFHDLCHKKERPAPCFIEGIGTALASRTLEVHFHAYGRVVKTKSTLSNDILNRLVAYIDLHLCDEIKVADLARHVAMSVDHFTRSLKGAIGLSPLQLLLKCRVEKALELLRTGKFRVGEAACEVGFFDQSHLDRHCRKFFGVPPKVLMRGALPESSLKMPETSKIVCAY